MVAATPPRSRLIQIDLLHIIRTEPIDRTSRSKKNGKR
jgi:hypothetical protein